MNRPWMISRRTLLRGAGTLIALPVLEAMAPAIARAEEQGKAPPRRMLVYFAPNGVNMKDWTPAATGADFELSRILQPLAPVKDDILVLSGLANRPGQADGSGEHAAGVASFITATHAFKTEGAGIRNNISMDQVVAKALGGETRFPSLQLGIELGGSTGSCDSGYSCAYARNISWSGPSTPLSKEISPRGLFDRLFRGQVAGASASAAGLRRRYKKSVLDFVLEDASRLRRKLGARDQQKLDEYTTGIRELERRLEDDGPARCPAPDRPEDVQDFRQRLRAMSDLMLLALQCDLTRVISFMLGNGLSGRVYDFLGVYEGHHQISHHQGNPALLEQLSQIDTWRVGELSYLLQRMKGVQEPDGSLLDNALVFFSSDVADGNAHTHFDLPVVVAGKGGGAFRTGRHVRYAEEQPVANLMISMMSALGVPVTRFGDDGTGPLPDLT